MVLGGYRAKVVTARNDPRINHHHLQLQGWRANRDMNIIIDYPSCVEYLTKYTSKAEKLSSVARYAFVSVITNSSILYGGTRAFFTFYDFSSCV